MRLLLIGSALVVLSACAPQLVEANRAGGIVAHVITVGPFEDTDRANTLASASCQRHGRIVRMNVPITALDGSDSTLRFDCVNPR